MWLQTVIQFIGLSSYWQYFLTKYCTSKFLLTRCLILTILKWGTIFKRAGRVVGIRPTYMYTPYWWGVLFLTRWYSDTLTLMVYIGLWPPGYRGGYLHQHSRVYACQVYVVSLPRLEALSWIKAVGYKLQFIHRELNTPYRYNLIFYYTAHAVVLTKILSQPVLQSVLFSPYCH